MCPPTALSFAVGAAAQVLSFKAQQAQSNAEHSAWRQAVEAAGKSTADQMSQENVRLQQEQAAGVKKQLDLRREALRAQGEVLASSESGGISEELLLADIERQRASYSDTVASNVAAQMQQSYWNKQGMVSDAQSRANANKPASTGGSTLGLGLGVMGAGLDWYNEYHIKKSAGAGDIASRNKT